MIKQFFQRCGRYRLILDRTAEEPYLEWVPQFDNTGKMIGETRHWRAPGSFRTAAANTYHRVELEPGITPWTLFMPGLQQRDWGFLVDNKWIPNMEFFDLRRKKA